MRKKEMDEKHAEVEWMKCLIHPIQQRIYEFTQALANTSLYHPSSDRVHELEQYADESCWEIEWFTPIVAQFQ